MFVQQEGILHFSGRWDERPCSLRQGKEEDLDLYTLFEKAFRNISGKPARETADPGTYLLTVDVRSDAVLDYSPGTLPCLRDIQGMEERTLSLPIVLLVNTGRRISVEFGETHFKIRGNR